MQNEHKVIWLQPWCEECAADAAACHNDIGRQWCKEPVWDDCEKCGAKPVKYVARPPISKDGEILRLRAELQAVSNDLIAKNATVKELQSVLKNATLETLQAIHERDALKAELAAVREQVEWLEKRLRDMSDDNARFRVELAAMREEKS